jgi:hypothetical protein
VRTTLRLGILILVAILITSCSPNKDGTKTTIIGLEGIQASEINKRIHITAPQGYNNFKINDLIGLVIQNYSNQQVRFVSKDIHLFIKVGDEWEETENNFFETRPFIVVGAKSPDNYEPVVVIAPVLTNQGSPINLRVVIIAIVYRNEKPTSIKTGAYIDLTLYP